MPRKYQQVLEVKWGKSSDGNHYLISLRYNAITINGIRYTRCTAKAGKHQLVWPSYRLLKGDGSIPYPAIRPAPGFTVRAVECIERWIEKQSPVRIEPISAVPQDAIEQRPKVEIVTRSYIISPCHPSGRLHACGPKLVKCSECSTEYNTDDLDWDTVRKYEKVEVNLTQ